MGTDNDSNELAERGLDGPSEGHIPRNVRPTIAYRLLRLPRYSIHMDSVS